MQNEISYSQNENENEPEAFSKDRGRQVPPRPSIKSVKPTLRAEGLRTENATPEATSPREPELALFSLIADPQTIAGENAPRPNLAKDNADQELDLLRKALHAREQELAELRRQSPPEQGEPAEAGPSFLRDHISAPAKSDEQHENRNSEERGLLDSTQAHRMAQEAKQSEQASRRALHTAQQEHRNEGVEEWPSRGDVMPPLGNRFANEQSWETRPLSVQKHLLETAPGVAARSGILPDQPTNASPLRVAPDRPTAPSATNIRLRAARAEVRELEATLSLARDTALTQKLEIARLRSQLEQAPESAADEMAALEDAFRSVLPEEESIDVEAVRIEAQNALRAELAHESEAAQQEIERLRARVALGEQEAEAREAERRILKETLAAREVELQSVRLELSQTTLRLRDEGEIVQELDASLSKEREHNAETQALLAQLRSALQQAPIEQAPIEEATPSPQPERAQQAPSHLYASVVSDQVGSADQVDLTDLAGAKLETPPAESGRLFDAWQDDQVRRHFGPFGIDTTRDLVMAPLKRRTSSPDHPAKILVLGPDAASWTERLAEDLIGNESPPFEIRVSTGAASAPRALRQDRPIDEFITSTRLPASPGDFEALLAETRPSVIVSRNFLSQMSEVGPWLDVLRQLPQMGPAIILLESTGIGSVSPSDSMIELGDRIWSLMPARYTRADLRSDDRLESWQEAFQQIQPLPSNGLRAALRDGFDLEISAQFGFLTEPFLRSRIAENFDPEAQRDRRFLHQIADLDDRKIEAGLAPALHFVARIDGRIED